MMIFRPFEIHIKPQNNLHFALENKQVHFNLGNITIGQLLPDYEGEYRVTPRVWEQVLLTNEKSMHDDVTIEVIPLNKVTNPQGGYTATIG